MSKIISIASCKGGIGKTTSTINLGTALAMQGKRILLVDNGTSSLRFTTNSGAEK